MTSPLSFDRRISYTRRSANAIYISLLTATCGIPGRNTFKFWSPRSPRGFVKVGRRMTLLERTGGGLRSGHGGRTWYVVVRKIRVIMLFVDMYVCWGSLRSRFVCPRCTRGEFCWFASARCSGHAWKTSLRHILKLFVTSMVSGQEPRRWSACIWTRSSGMGGWT
jgi:hypothetical protein